MKISYAITVCNELKEIKKLIPFILEHKKKKDEVVVLFDKGKGTAAVWSYLQEQNVISHAETFKHHFADWKNKLTDLCSGDYIFQIDADEIPNQFLMENLETILIHNPHNEVFLVPRVNTVKGLTEDHITKWKWRVDDKNWVNWPYLQWRIWKNDPKIKWVNKVHERLDGFKTYSPLPLREEVALYHHKSIKKQEKQNDYYNTL